MFCSVVERVFQVVDAHIMLVIMSVGVAGLLAVGLRMMI